MDKRKSIRIPVYRPVKIQTPSGNLFHGYVVDLSLTGVAIEFSAPAEPGTLLDLRFKIQVGGISEEICLKGSVMHSRTKGKNYVIGVHLLNLSEDTKTRITRYIYHVSEIRKRGAIE